MTKPEPRPRKVRIYFVLEVTGKPEFSNLDLQDIRDEIEHYPTRMRRSYEAKVMDFKPVEVE